MTQPTLRVRIISPQEILMDNDHCSSVSSKNLQGDFDILAEHANFLTVIDNQPITIRMVGADAVTVKFPMAIIFAASNIVTIYTYLQQSNKQF